MTDVVAPAVPGRLGEAIEPVALRTYFDALTQWIALRKQELDALDAAALTGARDGDDPTYDVALSMALWQSIVERERALQRVWNGGRVGPQERLEISTLLWGRLEPTGPASSGPGQNVTLLEATRLSDAMVESLRTRLGLTADVTEVQTRLRALRAQLERLRQQVALEPATAAAHATVTVGQFTSRLGDIAAQAERGGDVGGLLGPLELEASTFERDLIVNGNLRRRASAHRDELTARVEALRAAHDEARTAIDAARARLTPTPKYALPDVASVLQIPDDVAAWPDFEVKLERIAAAVAMVHKANTDAVSALDALVARLGALTPATKEATATVDFARQVARLTPTPIPVLTHAIAAAQAHCDLGGR